MQIYNTKNVTQGIAAMPQAKAACRSGPPIAPVEGCTMPAVPPIPSTLCGCVGSTPPIGMRQYSSSSTRVTCGSRVDVWRRMHGEQGWGGPSPSLAPHLHIHTETITKVTHSNT